MKTLDSQNERIYINTETLWKEYAILQEKINKYGDSSIRLKGFSLTLISAIGYISYSKHDYIFILLGILSTFLIIYYEGINLHSLNIFKERVYLIENVISNSRSKLRHPYIAHELSRKEVKNFWTPISNVLFKEWRTYIIYHAMIAVLLLFLALNIYQENKYFLATLLVDPHINETEISTPNFLLTKSTLSNYMHNHLSKSTLHMISEYIPPNTTYLAELNSKIADDINRIIDTEIINPDMLTPKTSLFANDLISHKNIMTFPRIYNRIILEMEYPYYIQPRVTKFLKPEIVEN